MLYKLNDASFGIKLSGDISVNNTYHGVLSAVGGNSLTGFSNAASYINHYPNPTSSGYVVGYTMVSRDNNLNFNLLTNNTIINKTGSSVILPNRSLYILNLNDYYGNNYFVPIGQIAELYHLGKSLSQSNYLIFQSIMNTYFASI